MSRKQSALAPLIGGRQYHINCKPGDVARYVLVPGDPERVGKIASLWDSAHEVAYHREYHTMTGEFKRTPISCTSSGIGGPALAIAVEAATLFTMSSIFGKRAGAICVIVANRVTDEFSITDDMQKQCGLVASVSVRILSGWDKQKKRSNKQYFFPALLT